MVFDPTRDRLILFTNESFYAAIRAGDMVAMDELWANEAPVACIHPGWPILVGRDDVMASWRTILQSPPGVHQEDARVVPIDDATALVVCRETIGNTTLAATNVFLREHGDWRLVHHQAGPTSNRRRRPRAVPRVVH